MRGAELSRRPSCVAAYRRPSQQWATILQNWAHGIVSRGNTRSTWVAGTLNYGGVNPKSRLAVFRTKLPPSGLEFPSLTGTVMTSWVRSAQFLVSVHHSFVMDDRYSSHRFTRGVWVLGSVGPGRPAALRY